MTYQRVKTATKRARLTRALNMRGPNGHSESALMEILCLAEPRDDILMWSHYANSHKGVCFGFATQEWNLLQEYAKPVSYKDVYPVINAFQSNSQEAAHAVAFTKFCRWAHEREWRVVRAATAAQRYSFPPQTLVEVIFGARISPSDLRRLLVMGFRSRSKPRYFQAIPEQGHFSLRLEEVSVTEQIIKEALNEQKQ